MQWIQRREGSQRPQKPQSCRDGSRRMKTSWSWQLFQIQHNFISHLHFPYFPEPWAVYRVRRIFALTWSNPVLWEPPKFSQGLREFQKPHFRSTVGLFAFLLWVLMLEEITTLLALLKFYYMGMFVPPPPPIKSVVFWKWWNCFKIFSTVIKISLAQNVIAFKINFTSAIYFKIIWDWIK